MLQNASNLTSDELYQYVGHDKYQWQNLSHKPVSKQLRVTKLQFT